MSTAVLLAPVVVSKVACVNYSPSPNKYEHSLEIDPNECSYCYLARVRRVAAEQRKIVTTNPARRFNRRHRKGIDVRVNGDVLYWMNKMPEYCECERF